MEIEEEEDKFIKENPIIFKKYKVKKKLGEGAFGDVYLGQTISNNVYVAIKTEPRKIVKPILESEAFLLYSIAGPGIPEVKSFGKTKHYNILIEPLLGSTLYSLYLDHNKNFTLKDICLISIQCITRLESVHNKGIIHCDIKPENFSIGLKDKRIIYLIDFGLSKKYRSDRTKRHIQFNITKTMCGTARYASMNALSGLQLSRRDDLESLSYMILYFLLKKLPWQGITAKNLEKRYKKIYDKKAELEKWDKFKELPTQIQNFVKYCRSLGFSQDPDYKLMKSYFYDLMNINNFFDDKNFSWILDKSIIGSKMPEFFPRKKYFSLYKFYDKIEKKKLSLSVGNHIKYDFNQDKITNENKKRNNSPINLKIDNKINNNEENNQDENVSLSDKSNSSVNGVQNYKLGKFSDNDEES